MKRSFRTAKAFSLLAAAGAAGAFAVAYVSPPAVAATRVASVPVAFQVKNVNRSAVPCASDGADYVLRGRLVGPASLLRRHILPAATLYLHGFAFGKFLWQFPVSGYDYAASQAKAGHVSVIVDRLGYDESPGPDGNFTCIGAHADMASQVIDQLKQGSYEAGGSGPVRFERIAIAGFSVGGLLGQVVAYSFGNVDALVMFGWADQGFTQLGVQESVKQGAVCLQGGEPAEPGGPAGYAYYGQSREDFSAIAFLTADPSVIDTAFSLRNRDPCGDSASLTTAIATDNANNGRLALPILLVYGEKDALWEDPPATAQKQRDMYTSSDDASVLMVEGAGHITILERAAPSVTHSVSNWLSDRGF
jgi:esterase/lipase